MLQHQHIKALPDDKALLHMPQCPLPRARYFFALNAANYLCIAAGNQLFILMLFDSADLRCRSDYPVLISGL